MNLKVTAQLTIVNHNHSIGKLTKRYSITFRNHYPTIFNCDLIGWQELIEKQSDLMAPSKTLFSQKLRNRNTNKPASDQTQVAIFITNAADRA